MFINGWFCRLHVFALRTSRIILTRINKKFISWDFSPVRCSKGTHGEPVRLDLLSHLNIVVRFSRKDSLLSCVTWLLDWQISFEESSLDIGYTLPGKAIHAQTCIEFPSERHSFVGGVIGFVLRVPQMFLIWSVLRVITVLWQLVWWGNLQISQKNHYSADYKTLWTLHWVENRWPG
jgi:hypothetical protein